MSVIECDDNVTQIGSNFSITYPCAPINSNLNKNLGLSTFNLIYSALQVSAGILRYRISSPIGSGDNDILVIFDIIVSRINRTNPIIRQSRNVRIKILGINVIEAQILQADIENNGMPVYRFTVDYDNPAILVTTFQFSPIFAVISRPMEPTDTNGNNNDNQPLIQPIDNNANGNQTRIQPIDDDNQALLGPINNLTIDQPTYNGYTSIDDCDLQNIPRVTVDYILSDGKWGNAQYAFSVYDIIEYEGYFCTSKIIQSATKCCRETIYRTKFLKYPQIQTVLKGNVCCTNPTRGTLSQKINYLIEKFHIIYDYDNFLFLLSFYAAARYILSALLYDKFSVKFLLGIFIRNFCIISKIADLINLYNFLQNPKPYYWMTSRP